MKLFHVVTVPLSLGFIKRQASFMRESGFEVHVVSSPGPGLQEFGERERVSIHSMEMVREITPVKDLVTLARLVRLFRREKPDIVHTHTPKAGLLATLAAYMAGVRQRIFHIHGLPHSTATGFNLKCLWWSTKASCFFATKVLSVSSSVAELTVQSGLCKQGKIVVLGSGTSNGVDAKGVFSPSRYSKSDLRNELEISDAAVVIGFAGRLVGDKGLRELCEAWVCLKSEFQELYLVLAGDPEPRDCLSSSVLQAFRSDERVHMLGWFKDTPKFYAAIDILALPSYREGFPTVVLEASAMQVPAVVARSTGCVDAVLDEVTGLLVDVAEAKSLTAALRRYIQSAELRQQHGKAARLRVLEHFSPETVWLATRNEYRTSTSNRDARSPRLTLLFFKRCFDFVVALAALTALLPLALLLCIAVRINLGSPVFFRQSRPGLGGRAFWMVKFRTMRDAFDTHGNALPDAERLTGFGKFLRSCSLDELPELWNVLKGDMSLVGPRPLLTQYLERYDAEQRRRHEVKPGITGWAQVNGRNAVSWEERLRLDVWYVDNRSFLLDVKILWRTLLVVFQRQGIAQDGHATMPEFGLPLNSSGEPK